MFLAHQQAGVERRPFAVTEADGAVEQAPLRETVREFRADADIDREYSSAMRALMTYMIEDPRHISRVINVMWVLRSLERIGDHARNISEQVIYMVKGLDVRHTDFDQVEQKIQGKSSFGMARST